jgi:hypothetical protein
VEVVDGLDLLGVVADACRRAQVVEAELVGPFGP